MDTSVFDRFALVAKSQAGIHLTADKAYLVESRLTPIAKRNGLHSLTELAAAVSRPGAARPLVQEVVDALTTNESSFFRDGQPFEHLKTKVFPVLLRQLAGRRPLRIWSAACSSGQEPYSLATLLDQLGARDKVEIVATDISSEMVARASRAEYSQFEVQRGMPVQLVVKYFTQHGTRWRVNEDLRQVVTVRQFNLMDDPRPLGKFDLVLCRNVLIYFEAATKRQILDRIAQQLHPGGLLMLGGSETIIGVSERFEAHEAGSGLFALKGLGAAPSGSAAPAKAWAKP